MRFYLRPSKSLVIPVAISILAATLLVPSANSITVTIKLTVSRGGQSNTFNFVYASFPIQVGFSINNSVGGTTDFWQFGDGTNSSNSAPTHLFNSPCVFNVQVRTTTKNGSVYSGSLLFGAFVASDLSTQTGRALAVCPQQGTAGITPVEVAGGYFPGDHHVTVFMNGTSLGNVTSDRGGDWILGVSSFLSEMPEPNDTRYFFTTSPPSLRNAFTTLEGVRATPSSGAPGDNVFVEGRSYPPNSQVRVYLGGPSLGSAQTNVNGSFESEFSVPYSPPLVSPGTYSYSTVPAILGSQATFTSKGVFGAGLAWWWWLLLLIALILIAIYLVRRRTRRREPVSEEGPRQPTEASYAWWHSHKTVISWAEGISPGHINS